MNYFAANLGKAAPDGIRTTVKRLTDAQVHLGKDCKDASDMMHLMHANGSKIKLYFVESDAIDKCLREYANYS